MCFYGNVINIVMLQTSFVAMWNAMPAVDRLGTANTYSRMRGIALNHIFSNLIIETRNAI